LNSTDADFEKNLRALSKSLGCTVGIECVAGEMSGQVQAALPRNGILIIYGQLSEQKIGPVNCLKFLSQNQRIEGFFLPYWLSEKSLWG